MRSTPTPRMMSLGLSMRGTGYHSAGWRDPSTPDNAELDPGHFARVARIAEAAKFDMVFLADALGMRDLDLDREALARTARVSRFEPITLLSYLAGQTSHIGLVGTASTSYNEPFHIARKFASLDHLSGGRAGWNVVTSLSDDEARNFGRETHFSYADRYERAREFVHVTFGLWQGWEEHAFIRDKQSGIFFDPDKLHLLNHKGKHFSVQGPLNIDRPIQGYPLISQAGQSEDGQELAAETADIVFSIQNSIEGAKSYYDSVKGRLAKYGREPDELRVLPGLQPIVGRTEDEARAKFDALQALVDEGVGMAHLTSLFGDLSAYPIDGPLPDMEPKRSGAAATVIRLARDIARGGDLTIRQLYQALAPGRGHKVLIGSPIRIADTMEEWFRAGAADGFNITPATLPRGIEDFAELVVPELQRRGLFRTEYTGRTLRENMGVRRIGGTQQVTA
ncbi:LLM class flavin-dependent oxidoreductase [Rhizobium puerariae]|uniref:LLM class flavin-dependent oxidoreductase n=1 Tax=Rhizobium puerariae TaxID=1585791 RepID=A0ABV6ADQ6_9HYPH